MASDTNKTSNKSQTLVLKYYFLVLNLSRKSHQVDVLRYFKRSINIIFYDKIINQFTLNGN